jgi:hypothetical protein
MEKITEFCTQDPMIKELYQVYVIDKELPTKIEAIEHLRFFATMSVGSSKAGLKDIAEIFSKRLEAYNYIMHVIGYKFGKRWVGKTDTGINSLFQTAFWGIE